MTGKRRNPWHTGIAKGLTNDHNARAARCQEATEGVANTAGAARQRISSIPIDAEFGWIIRTP
jgi:hypothetical protein